MELNELDELDKRIIAELEKDPRASYTDIAKVVGISRVAVKSRIDSLIERGVIAGFKTLLSSKRVYENAVEFVIDIVAYPDRVADVADALAKMNDIKKVYLISGESKLHATGFAPSVGALDRFVASLYKEDVGINRILVQTVLSVLKDSDGGVEYDRTRLRSNNCNDGGIRD